MSISLEAIEKLGQLARLALSKDEVHRLQNDLNKIVGYVENLQKVNVDGVEPMTHAVPVEFLMRLDEAKSVVGREGLKGSSGYEEGLVKVPKIIE